MTNAVTTQQQKPATLGQFLDLRKAHLAAILPKSSALTADKLVKLCQLAAKRNSRLSECPMDSIFNSLMQCAELGLDPSGATGEAHLVPYKSHGVYVCQLIIGYRGYIKLARNSGVLKQIETHVVHDRDKFILRFGLEPKLEHEPCLDADQGQPKLVYCIARMADGAQHVEVMTWAEVQKVRQRSKAKDDGPWVSDPEEMGRKTVLRRAAKYLPQSSELQRAEEYDGDTIEGQVVQASDAAAMLSASRTEEVKALMKGKAPAVIDMRANETEEQAVARTEAEAQDVVATQDGFEAGE